jgi:gamma-glutamyltranspeptidase/glutathione hydrolase
LQKFLPAQTMTQNESILTNKILQTPSGQAHGKVIVSCASPWASHAALEILKAGGSAADAIVAAQSVLALVEPHASGFGGGTVVVWHNTQTGESGVMDGLACAPGRVTSRLEVDFDGKKIPRERVMTGGFTVGVPGTVKTLSLAHQRFGRLPWVQLFDRARELSEGGFLLPPYLVKTINEIGPIQDEPLAKSVYCQGERLTKPAGTLVNNPLFSVTLKQIAEQGADAFYEDSAISKDLLSTLHHDTMPSHMTLQDLQSYRVVERETLQYSLGDQTILTAPPPVFGGLAVGQILTILDILGRSHVDPSSSAEQIHCIAEAGRMAFADRGAYVGDPAYSEIPQAQLIDRNYLQARAKLIHLDQRIQDIHPGIPEPSLTPASDGTGIASAMTSHLVVADAYGLCISMTTTINQNFGSRLSTGGFFVNNALTNFARVPKAGDQRVSVNAMEPGKRPITSFAPSLVLDNHNQPLMLVGAGGGNRIVGFVTNAILRMRSGQLNPQEILAAPQVLNWSGVTDIEPGLSHHVPALKKMSHWPLVRRMDGGTHAAILQNGIWHGGADTRRDGAAMGF